MTLDRALPLGIAALSWLGTLLLCLGQREALFPLIALAVTAGCLVIVDWQAWFRLPNWGANLAGVGALLLCGIESLRRWGGESQLLAVANLMIYLQFILLAQQKNEKRFWLLLLLSALQVAVASALSLELYFGILLLIYLVLALLTLILFLLHRERARLRAHSAAATHSAVLRATRWPLPNVSRPFVSRTSAEPLHELRTWAFARQFTGMLAATLSLAVGVFLFVPRIGHPAWRPYTTATPSVTGFTESVTLGDLGPIIESTQEVMRVQFSDLATRYSYELIDEPLLRGSVLTRYSGGRWTQRPTSEQALRPLPGDSLPEQGDAVVQRSTVEPLDTEVLFCLYPVFNLYQDRNLIFDAQRRQILRRDPLGRQELSRVQLTFEVVTSGLLNGRQMPLTPLGQVDPWLYTGEMQRVPPGLERMTELARSLVADIPVSDRLGRARALENYLGVQGGFGYTLRLSGVPASQDPVEHFLFQSREGHCEYFATALAMMLRAVDIPSRLVVGYKGGEWNPLGNFYQFRQLHTHAWVEAYIEPGQLSANLQNDPQHWGGGAWLRLDPTPSADATLAGDSNGWRIASWSQLREYSKYLWSSHVLGMNADRQRESVYGPILRAVQVVAQRTARPREWRQSWTDFTAWLQFGFHWRAGLLGAILCGLGIVAYRVARSMARRLTPLMRRLGRGRKLARSVASRVEFYRRLQQMLAEKGWRRAANETPREFAQAFAERPTADDDSDSARQITAITEAYYQVRFGEQPLPSTEGEEVVRWLERLPEALRNVRGRR